MKLTMVRHSLPAAEVNQRADARGLERQAGGQFDAFVARQLASESRKDQADSFLGPFPGG